MSANKYLLVISSLVLGGCNSDDVNITNNYVTETPVVISPEEQKPIGEFELKTSAETDFFVVEKELGSREYYYTNSNAFHFDKDGVLVNRSGSPLLVFPVNHDGSSASVAISVTDHLRISYAYGAPRATDSVTFGVNLPEIDAEMSANEFNNNDPLTFNHSASVSVIDSLGDTHTLTFYFIHVGAESNTWEYRIALNGVTVQPVTEQILDFNSNGLMDINDDDLDGFVTTGNGLIEDVVIQTNNGAEDLNISLDFSSDTTALGNNFEVTSLSASGSTVGRLKQMKIASDGLITLSYNNGRDEFAGRVALAKFMSPYNLKPIGNSLWEETDESGEPLSGEAGSGNFHPLTPFVYDF